LYLLSPECAEQLSEVELPGSHQGIYERDAGATIFDRDIIADRDLRKARPSKLF
jgi:hypothetical protein